MPNEGQERLRSPQENAELSARDESGRRVSDAANVFKDSPDTARAALQEVQDRAWMFQPQSPDGDAHWGMNVGKDYYAVSPDGSAILHLPDGGQPRRIDAAQAPVQVRAKVAQLRQAPTPAPSPVQPSGVNERVRESTWTFHPQSTENDAHHGINIGADYYAVSPDGSAVLHIPANGQARRIDVAGAPAIVQNKVTQLRPNAAPSRPERVSEGALRLHPATAESDAHWGIQVGTEYYAVSTDGKLILRIPKGGEAVFVNASDCPDAVKKKAAELNPPARSEQPVPEPSRLAEQAPEPKREIVTRADVLKQLSEKAAEALREFSAVKIDASAVRVSPDISNPNVANYRANMLEALANMKSILGTLQQPAGTVAFDGREWTFTDAKGEKIITNAAHTFRQKNGEPNTLTLLDESGKELYQVVRDTSERRSARYGIFEHKGQSAFKELMNPDGSVAARESADGVIQWFNGEGAQRNKRPTLLHTEKNAVARTIPIKDGSPERQQVRLEKGMYYVPETGEPIAPYRSPNADAIQNALVAMDVAQRQGDTDGVVAQRKIIDNFFENERPQIQVFLKKLADRLKTPEAIARYFSSQIQVESEARFDIRQPHSVVQYKPKNRGEGYVQSALETVFLRRGDCKYIAAAIQETIAIANAEREPSARFETLLVRSASSHFKTVYLEKHTDGNGNDTYDLCLLDLGGFQRIAGFASPEDAMRKVWDDSSNASNHPDAITFALKQAQSELKRIPESSPLYAVLKDTEATLQKVLEEKGGMMIFEKNDKEEPNESVVSFKEFNKHIGIYIRKA